MIETYWALTSKHQIKTKLVKLALCLLLLIFLRDKTEGTRKTHPHM